MSPAIVYLLVLTLNLGGNVNVFVMDHGLTMMDCAMELADNSGADLRCDVEDDTDKRNLGDE